LPGIGIPPSIVPFYTLSSVILLIQIIKDLKENKKIRIWLYVLTGISLALGFMTYPTQKIFVPMMVVIFFLVILFRNKIEKKRLLKLILIPIVLFVLVIGHLLPFITESNRYNFRFSVVSLTSKYQGINLVVGVGRRYLQYFSPQFLLLRGDLIKMQHVENYGLITIPVTVFFYISLILMSLKLFRSIIKKERINQVYAFILLTTLAAPLMASMTKDNYHTLRAIHFFSLIPIVSTLGILELKEILKKELHKKVLMIFVVLSVIFSIIYSFSFFNYYTTTYREKNKWAYQYGVKDLIDKANTITDKPVIIDNISINMPYIYYLFFNKVTPNEEVFCDVNDCKNYPIRPIGWVNVKKIGNVRFSDISKEDCKANYCLGI
jgi:4-amino-4-deoxy-L-arabinose transferase-like glycosyltransferase